MRYHVLELPTIQSEMHRRMLSISRYLTGHPVATFNSLSPMMLNKSFKFFVKLYLVQEVTVVVVLSILMGVEVEVSSSRLRYYSQWNDR